MTRVRSVARRTFQSLHKRNARLYFAGQVVSQVGTWMQLVALPWLVLHMTGSGVSVGIATALQFIPALVLGAWFGVLIDRLDTRRLLQATASAAAITSLALGVIVITAVAQVWMIYGFALVLGTINAIDSPARRAFVPQLVDESDITNAIGLNNAMFTSARLIGPALAGFIAAGAGTGWCFLLNGMSYVSVVVALQLMDRDELRRAPVVERAKGQVREGLRYAWATPRVRTALVMTSIIGALSFNYAVVLPLMATRVFHAGAGMFGVMYAVNGIGSLSGALITAHQGRVSRRIMASASIVFGAAMLAGAAAPSIAVELLVLVPMGAAMMLFFSTATAACQVDIDPALQGRVIALFSAALLGSTAVGSPLVGWVAQVAGARAGFVVGGLTAVVTGGVALAGVRRRRRSATVARDGAVQLAA